MHAVCQLMGMNLKRCQVVRGHRGGGWDRGQPGAAGEEELTGEGARAWSIKQKEGGRRKRFDKRGIMLRGWNHHYARLSLYSVVLNVFDRSEKRSTWKQRAERKGLKLKPSYKPRHQLKTSLSCWQYQLLKWADPYFNGYKHNSNFSLFSVKSKAVGSNDTVWVSIYQILLLQVLEKTSIFCNILSLSNWQIDVSPETLYWQPNVVETRGSQDRDQRPE